MTTSADHNDTPIRQLYENKAYPDMSHPLVDPAVTAVAAALGGLASPPPSRARILEIGCAAGHHLLPLAMRWPESRLIGIDFTAAAIATARQRAAAVGLANVSFHQADIRDYVPEGDFDYIIAHGFFSWVPDNVKAALFKFCQRHLSPTGIATISFNLSSGWAQRLPVIELVRHLCQAHACDEIAAISFLLDATPTAAPAAGNIRWILEDMLAKGPDILPFDDFSPLNEPWGLEQFLASSSHFGLTWIGEADPAENIPSALDDAARQQLSAIASEPLGFQIAADVLTGRTLRAGVLRRSDAPAQPGFKTDSLLNLALRAGKNPPPPDHPAAPLHHALTAMGPQCHPAEALAAELPDIARPQLARLIFEGISRGVVRPRIEPASYDSSAPQHPRLDPLRLFCARERLPIADAFHVPCSFPRAHFGILAEMNGRHSRAALAETARQRCPELHFDPWLSHLAERGMFQEHPLTSSL